MISLHELKYRRRFGRVIAALYSSLKFRGDAHIAARCRRAGRLRGCRCGTIGAATLPPHTTAVVKRHVPRRITVKRYIRRGCRRARGDAMI